MSALVLEVTAADGTVRRVPLDEGDHPVGRGPGNAVLLDDPRVSRHHARVVVRGGAVSLVDLGTAAGSTLNGAPVTGTVALAPGDEVRIGSFRLALAGPPPAAPPPARAPAPDTEFRHLVAELLQLTNLVGVTDLHAVLAMLLDRVKALLMASRGFIVLARDGELTPVVRTSGASPEDDPVFSRTVCTRAIESRRSVVLSGPDAAEHIKSIESLAASLPRTIVAIPLVEGADVLGVLYLEGERFLPAAWRDNARLLDELSGVGGRALRVALERDQLVSARECWRVLASQEADEPDLARTSKSPAMRKVLALVGRVAAEDITALILGESGAGKEVISRAIHRQSPRRNGPYVAVNCGAIPRELIEGELFGHERGAFTGASARQPGRFELANGGTLLLDEIGDLPLDMQVKLLRVLESRRFERVGGRETLRFDGRVLAATNHDLHALVAAGKFRADLLYRLDVVSLRLPPLRERLEDLPELVSDLLLSANRRFRRKLYGVTPEAMAAMAAYPWPGNIRELRNVIERAFVLEPGDTLSCESLPLSPPPRAAAAGPALAADRPIPTIAEFVRAQECEYIRFVIAQTGTMSRAAEVMGLTRSALYKKMRALGLRTGAGDASED